jgi:hypothetical protein
VPKETKSGHTSFKTREGLVQGLPLGRKIVPIFSFFLFVPGYFNYDYRTLCQRDLWDLSKASLNLKSALWGDKPEGLLPENCPNFFFFFFVWAGTLWALVTSPDFGVGKTTALCAKGQGKVFSGIFFCRRQARQSRLF